MNNQLYNFTVSEENRSRIWRIKHPLNGYPIAMVYDSNNSQLFLDTHFTIKYIDENNLELIFNRSQYGSAQLMISNNTKTINIPKEHITDVQISKSKVVTIAIHSHDDNYSPLLLINDGYDIIPFDNFNTVENVKNAWDNVNTVHINGNNYNVYSLYLFPNTKINDKLYSLKCPHPYNKYDSDILKRFKKEFNDDKCYILLSNTVENYDKILDQIIDINDLDFENNYISNGELFVKSNIIKTIYPTILTA